MIVKVTKALDWHVEGDILDRNVAPLEIPANYLENMKANLSEEAAYLKEKKESKIRELKLKKSSDRSEAIPQEREESKSNTAVERLPEKERESRP
ncbi:MAG: hypothetical protein JST59_00265 [Actinobacteria bacterium]|nr:hypothetical protein [Actinomycetota bacterium]